MDTYFVVRYSGPFGFIKPWTAVRDSETFSQQFLTPSIVEGIEKKIFPDLLETQGIQKVVRHRLTYHQISSQQEVIQTRGWNQKRQGKQFLFDRPRAIIVRGVLLNPTLSLAFSNKDDAEQAFTQHVCLSRNEDVLLPTEIVKVSQQDFDDEYLFPGFELIFEKNEDSFLVGYNRLTNEPMYGWLKIVGTPTQPSFR